MFFLIKTVAPGYFARGDTKTPVKIAALTTVVNLGLNLLLMGPFLHVGIAIATVISSWLNACLLGYFLWRRGHLRFDARLMRRVPRAAGASAAMGAVLVALLAGVTPWLDDGLAERVAALAVLVGGGLVVFAAGAHGFGAVRMHDWRGFLNRRSAPQDDVA